MTDHRRNVNTEPRCIRVDCVPCCPTCQPHYSMKHIIRNNLTAIGYILFIVILASYIVHTMQSFSNEKAFSDVHDNISGVKGIIDNKLKNLNDNGNDDTKCILNKLDQMQLMLEYISNKIENINWTTDKSHNVEMDNVAIKKLIMEQLRIYDSDKTGRPDFALESLGGCVLTIRNTQTYTKGAPQVSLLGIPIITYPPDPRSIIQNNVSPGECWAFEGSKGTVVIQLIGEIIISHVTLEHIPQELSPNGKIDSAPNEFSLWGLHDIDDPQPHLFGTYHFQKQGSPIQTFKVQSMSEQLYRIVEFTVQSNHGNPNFTCIYRVRIHGLLQSYEIQ